MNVKLLAICAVAAAGCAEVGPNAPGPNEPKSELDQAAADTPNTTPTPKGAAPRIAKPSAVSSPPAKGAAAVAQVDANLARLQALDVVQIGQLVVDYPLANSNCYGPCPGAEAQREAALQQVAERLASFVSQAETAAKAPSPGPCDATIDANVAALASLKIVDVTGFAKSVPVQNPNCYAPGCPADIAAAKATNAEKACRLDAIVKGTKL